jgi:hypothetical protein
MRPAWWKGVPFVPHRARNRKKSPRCGGNSNLSTLRSRGSCSMIRAENHNSNFVPVVVARPHGMTGGYNRLAELRAAGGRVRRRRPRFGRRATSYADRRP